jgi:hypothetical protein
LRYPPDGAATPVDRTGDGDEACHDTARAELSLSRGDFRPAAVHLLGLLLAAVVLLTLWLRAGAVERSRAARQRRPDGGRDNTCRRRAPP